MTGLIAATLALVLLGITASEAKKGPCASLHGLPAGCSIADNCLDIKCSVDLKVTHASMEMKASVCAAVPSLSVALGFFGQTVNDTVRQGDTFGIHGLSGLPGTPQVQLEELGFENNEHLTIKLKAYYEVPVIKKKITLFELPFDLPITKEEACPPPPPPPSKKDASKSPAGLGYLGPVPILYLAIGGGVLVLIIVIACAWCCCRQQQQTVRYMPVNTSEQDFRAMHEQNQAYSMPV
eukprot:m.78551 g.78551  ORF g.78551 m.78551 type:complete len:237 (-) comp14117_c0_seq1:124-834(-)